MDHLFSHFEASLHSSTLNVHKYVYVCDFVCVCVCMCVYMYILLSCDTKHLSHQTLFTNTTSATHMVHTPTLKSDPMSSHLKTCQFLKGDPKQRCKLAENVGNVHIFPPADFTWLFYQQFKKYFLHFKFDLLGVQPCWFALYRAQKRFACGLVNTFATHAGLVQDITDTGRWAQNGGTQGCVFVTFKHPFLPSRTRNWLTNCCVSVFHSI